MTIVELETYLNRSNLLLAQIDNDSILVFPMLANRNEGITNNAIFRLTLKDEKNVNIESIGYEGSVDQPIRGLRGSLEYDVKYLGFTRR